MLCNCMRVHKASINEQQLQVPSNYMIVYSYTKYMSIIKSENTENEGTLPRKKIK